MRLSDAQLMLETVVRNATERSHRFSIAVVDHLGHEVASVRMDGARWLTPGVARIKARTAVAFSMPSSETANIQSAHPEVFRIAGEQLPFRPTTLPGGLPIFVDEDLVGGIGVSGAQPDEDVRAAQEAIAAALAAGMRA